MGSDYYAVLGVDPGADAEAIKRAYRRKALELHPDRNGGSREAEEGFKRVTEAYAVLGDPARRTAYDARSRSGAEGGPGPDPADLFADLFRNPAFAALFAQLHREFAQQGLRFDEAYLRRVVSGGRGGFWFSGFVFVGPWGGGLPSLLRALGRTAPPTAERDVAAPPKRGLLHRLLGAALPRPAATPSRQTTGTDVRYTLPVAAETLRGGGRVRIAVPGVAGRETYDVRVPAGSSSGTRLRLPGRGAPGPAGRGDLYLELRAAS